MTPNIVLFISLKSSLAVSRWCLLVPLRSSHVSYKFSHQNHLFTLGIACTH